MANKKPVARLPNVDLPAWMCGNCYFYRPDEIDHGGCFGVPPTPVMAQDGDVMYPRPIVFSDDCACVHWKARHRA